MAVDWRSAHSGNSALREIILEHGFVADVLRHLWRRGIFDVEVLRSEFDAGGYDLVLSRGEITRHVQLKATRRTGKTRHFPISERLAAREAGCVVVIVVEDDLAVAEYRWFGGSPGQPLPDIARFPRARHTRGDASGSKGERQQHVRLPLAECARMPGIEEVIEALIGPVGR
jgi:hypothetical protein